MPVDLHHEYCENSYIYQNKFMDFILINSSDSLHGPWENYNNSKDHRYLKQKEYCWRHHNVWPQTILQRLVTKKAAIHMDVQVCLWSVIKSFEHKPRNVAVLLYGTFSFEFLRKHHSVLTTACLHQLTHL